MQRTMLAVLATAGSEVISGVISAVLLAVLAMPVGAQADADGPDPGVARLSVINGDVTVRRGDTGEAIAGELNAPLVASDHVITGPGSRAEVQFDYANMLRLAAASEVRLGELEDRNYLIQIAAGTTTFRVLRDSSALVEISTPNVSIRPSEKGTYRVTVRPDGSTEVTVRDGRADIFSQRGSEILRDGQTLVARGTASDPEYMISSAIPRDDWDRWNQNRDTDLERSRSYQYVSRDIYGADDLDGHGRWVYDAPYGYVWVPNVSVGWAPYRVGRWTYMDYYGWTWLSGDPWGWAPYHYGNWYSSSFGWAWYPGVVGPRYYWRPALVGFFGWGSGSIGIGFGNTWGFGHVGWVPLAPYEVFRPWYGRGFRNNTNIVVVNNTNITNIYRNSRNFNGRTGVTGVRSENFGRGRVENNIVQVNSRELNRAGDVRGRLPFEATAQSRRFSDREPNVTAASVRGNGNQSFVTRPDRGNRNNIGNSNGGNNSGQAARINTNPTGNPQRQPNANTNTAATPRSNGGWRRFDPQTDNAPRANQPGSNGRNNAGASPSASPNVNSGNNRQSVDSAPRTRAGQTVQSGAARPSAVQPSAVRPSAVRPSEGFVRAPRANPGSGSTGGGNPGANRATQAPVVRSGGNPGGGGGAPAVRSGGNAGGGGGAPAVRSGGNSSGGAARSNAGGGGGGGGSRGSGSRGNSGGNRGGNK